MIDSPCNDICTTDPESGLCVGCGRTQEEISNWLFFDDKQKKMVLKLYGQEQTLMRHKFML